MAALHADSWRRAYRGAFSDEFLDRGVEGDRLAVWTDRFASPVPNQWTLLAEGDDGDHDGGGGLWGFVHLYVDDDPRWGTLVDNLHVSHGHRREGLGRTLMSAAAEHVARAGEMASMYLWVLAQNTTARRFYAGIGGEEVESGEWEPPGGGRVVSYRCAWTDLTPLIVPRSS